MEFMQSSSIINTSTLTRDRAFTDSPSQKNPSPQKKKGGGKKSAGTWKFKTLNLDKKRSIPALLSATFKSKSPKRNKDDDVKTHIQRGATTERGRIMTEILESEIRYEGSLLTIQRVFYNPLRKAEPAILEKRTINIIFSNLMDIVNFSSRLRDELQTRFSETDFDPDHGCIGDIFAKLVPFMKVYSFYALRFKDALKTIKKTSVENKEFYQFLKRGNSKPECKNLGLEALLLMPIQRIPRYRLLIENLLKETQQSHPDYVSLQKSLRLIEEIVSIMNEQVREYEMYIEIVNIQGSIKRLDKNLLSPGRKLLMKGELKKVCRKNHQVRQVFLFSDMLIYCSPSSFMEGQYNFHRKIDLDFCSIKKWNGYPYIPFAFQVNNPVKSFILYAESQKNYDKWMESFEKGIEALKDQKESISSTNNNIEHDHAKDRIKLAYTAPIWVPDRDAAACMVCEASFGMFRRKHHCRMCGKVVCHACSSKSFVIPGIEEDRVVRACDVCLEHIKEEGKLEIIDTSNMSFLSGSAASSTRTSMDSIASNSTAGTSNNNDYIHDLSNMMPTYRRRVYESKPLSVISSNLWNEFSRLSMISLPSSHLLGYNSPTKIASTASASTNRKVCPPNNQFGNSREDGLLSNDMNDNHSVTNTTPAVSLDRQSSFMNQHYHYHKKTSCRSTFEEYRRFSVDHYQKDCSLCCQPFSLTKWRYKCSECMRIACLDCMSSHHEYYQRQQQHDNQNENSSMVLLHHHNHNQHICDPCSRGVPRDKVIVYGPGKGWGCREL